VFYPLNARYARSGHRRHRSSTNPSPTYRRPIETRDNRETIKNIFVSGGTVIVDQKPCVL